jgi:hypothetical protein
MELLIDRLVRVCVGEEGGREEERQSTSLLWVDAVGRDDSKPTGSLHINITQCKISGSKSFVIDRKLKIQIFRETSQDTNIWQKVIKN